MSISFSVKWEKQHSKGSLLGLRDKTYIKYRHIILLVSITDSTDTGTEALKVKAQIANQNHKTNEYSLCSEPLSE